MSLAYRVEILEEKLFNNYQATFKGCILTSMLFVVASFMAHEKSDNKGQERDDMHHACRELKETLL